MGISKTMQGVYLTGHGGFEKLDYRDDIPTPNPQAGEVLIQVGAAGVNNTDINTRIAWYSKQVRGDTNSGGGWRTAEVPPHSRCRLLRHNCCCR